MPGLAHPRIEVLLVRVDIAADVPDEVVEIPAFDPALPCTAEHRVQFSREQAGQVIESNRESAQPVEDPQGCATGKRRVLEKTSSPQT